MTQTEAANEANQRRRPGVDINDRRISDWVNGKHVPEEPELTHLVRVLIQAVRKRLARERRAYEELGLAHQGLLNPEQWQVWREAALRQHHVRPTAGQQSQQADRSRPVGNWSAQRLGVHPAISGTAVEHRHQEFVLPRYVARTHDARLREHLRAAVGAGAAPLLVKVVGESCTGKTRTALEAVRAVVPDTFELVFPADASGLAALLAAGAPAPGTVLWLDEAQIHLAGPLGEDIAAALLRRLDADGPLIVIATLWPVHHQALTATPATNSPDPHHLVRRLLAQARSIDVPDTFADDFHSVRHLSARDRSLSTVVELGSTVTQNLAAGPDLVRHFEQPSGRHGRHGRALVAAAMDARRLGVESPLPLRFLRAAAPGYLTDAERAQADTDWFTDAFDYSRTLIKQVAVSLPDMPRPTGMGALPGVVGLADYLQQHGRRTRRAMCPPAAFWEAALAHFGQGDDLFRLGFAARLRHRLQWAHRLYRRAAEVGSAPALSHLADGSADPQVAERLYHEAFVAGDTSALLRLGLLRENVHDAAGAADLYRQAITAGDAAGYAFLGGMYERADDLKEAESLYQRAVEQGANGCLASLARLHENAGNRSAAIRLYRQAVNAGATGDLIFLARIHRESGEHEAAEACYQEAIDAGAGDILIQLTDIYLRLGDEEGAAALIRRAAEAGVLGALVLTSDPYDEAVARSLYNRALRAGDDTALTLLGKLRDGFHSHDGAEHLYVLAANCASQQRQFFSRWPYGLDPDGTPTPAW
ncbi:tetratricopeptide repeat protein [Streptomyces sp. NPDC051016]|uniref:tetratricopeptide repeat protein n=1 Tax=Streptomyces sp. NPDC051016 TaxID=3365638 RepID=UPI0037A1D429